MYVMYIRFAVKAVISSGHLRTELTQGVYVSWQVVGAFRQSHPAVAKSWCMKVIKQNATHGAGGWTIPADLLTEHGKSPPS
jgi:hypothetical protein